MGRRPKAGFFRLFEDLGDIHYILEMEHGKPINARHVGEVLVDRWETRVL
jgi:hypothetical protein